MQPLLRFQQFCKEDLACPAVLLPRIKVRVVHVMDSMVVARFPAQKFYVGILLPLYDVNEM